MNSSSIDLQKEFYVQRGRVEQEYPDLWRTLRTFDSRVEAEAEACWLERRLGDEARVRVIHVPRYDTVEEYRAAQLRIERQTYVRPALTVTAFFDGQYHAQPRSADSIRAEVAHAEQRGFRRVRGKTGTRRECWEGQSRFTVRMRDPQTRKRMSLLFTLGEPRLVGQVA